MNEFKQMHRVFVYGSLKSGFGNHGFLEESEFLGTTYTKDTNFIMFSFGAFPAVIKDDNQGYGAIEGEVYLVDGITLFKLDMLESNGQFYTRELVDLDDGEKAWMYILNSPSKHMSPDDEQIQITYYDDKLVFIWRQARPSWYDKIIGFKDDNNDETEVETILLGSGEEEQSNDILDLEAEAEWERFNEFCKGNYAKD